MTVFVIVVQVVLTIRIGNVIAITQAETVADIDITRIDLDVVAMVSATISATAAVAAMIAVIAAAPAHTDLVEGPTPAHAIVPARPGVIAHMESPGGCAWVINSAYIRGGSTSPYRKQARRNKGTNPCIRGCNPRRQPLA